MHFEGVEYDVVKNSFYTPETQSRAATNTTEPTQEQLAKLTPRYQNDELRDEYLKKYDIEDCIILFDKTQEKPIIANGSATLSDVYMVLNDKKEKLAEFSFRWNSDYLFSGKSPEEGRELWNTYTIEEIRKEYDPYYIRIQTHEGLFGTDISKKINDQYTFIGYEYDSENERYVNKFSELKQTQFSHDFIKGPDGYYYYALKTVTEYKNNEIYKIYTDLCTPHEKSTFARYEENNYWIKGNGLMGKGIENTSTGYYYMSLRVSYFASDDFTTRISFSGTESETQSSTTKTYTISYNPSDNTISGLDEITTLEELQASSKLFNDLITTSQEKIEIKNDYEETVSIPSYIDVTLPFYDKTVPLQPYTTIRYNFDKDTSMYKADLQATLDKYKSDFKTLFESSL